MIRVGLILLLIAAGNVGASPDCAPCHQAETEAFAKTGMARALESATSSAILKSNSRLKTQIGSYSYEIVRGDGLVSYAVSDGKDAFRTTIDWAFGQGTAGQTYVFQRDGHWYESRVSYFSALHGLDLTMGMQNITPHNLLEAAGRRAGSGEMGQCFGCHATNVLKTDLSNMIPGVQCERCHGPADAHVKSQAKMRTLAALSSEDMADFCGQCHRTWSQIAANGPHGIENIRFQPYRLANSKCYDAADARIRCTACHNPHRPLEVSAAAYDAKCLACHAAKACKVANRECVTCHMPQMDLPGAHKKFTDHRIRVVRANEPYPD